MSSLPQLTEADIRHWVGETSFGRGRPYFQNGAIVNPRRQENTLKAQCWGSDSQPYRVQVALGPQGILADSCSCPVASHCKHVAALLLTWLNQPDEFTSLESLTAALEKRNKAELIALITRMIDRYPDLERLVEIQTLAETGTHRAVDPAVIRRQVQAAFRSAGDEWGAGADIALELKSLLDVAEEAIKSQQWQNAATIYATLAEEVLDYEDLLMSDESGELGQVVNRCVEGLAECLSMMTDRGQRESVLRTLFDIIHWDVEAGGIGIGDDAPEMILEYATPAERQSVAQWVRAVLPKGDSWSDNYHRRIYGGLLLSLLKEELDDEGYLRLSRETGHLPALINRLLDLQRVDEAATEARQASDYDLLTLADLFVAKGQGDRVERLIRDRLPRSRDSRLVEWLKRRAQARGDSAETLSLAESLFWQMPTLTGYKELKELAGPLGRWESLRSSILARLTQEKKYNLLTEIYLEENEIDQALQTVEQVNQQVLGGLYQFGSPLSIRVAQAAEPTRPREAICLYSNSIHQLINARGRENYATAVKYLLRVRDLYRRLDEEAAWQTLITNIREQNRSLRALKEELAKVKL